MWDKEERRYLQEIYAVVAKGILAISAGEGTAFTNIHIAVVALHTELRVAPAGLADLDGGFREPLGHFPAIVEASFAGLNLPVFRITVETGSSCGLLLLGCLEEQVHGAT